VIGLYCLVLTACVYFKMQTAPELRWYRFS